MSNSYDQFPDIGVDLYDLEAILIDPAIRSVLHKSIAINAEGDAHGGIERNKAQHVSRMLDEELESLSGMSPCSISGRLETFVPDENGGHFVTAMVNDLQAVNKGFYAVPTEQARGNDSDSYQVALLFEYEDKERNLVSIGQMLPHEINSITYRTSISLEQASALLRYYVPEIIDTIAERIAIIDTTDEVAMVMELYDLIYDMDVGGVDPIRLIHALNVYMEQAVKFDTQVPYAIKAKSNEVLSLENDSFDSMEMDVEGMLVEVIRTCFMAPPTDDDSMVVYPHLEIDTVCVRKEQQSRRVYLPLRDVGDLRSMRRNYYDENGVEVDE